MGGFNLGDIFTTIKVQSEGVKEAADGARNVGVQAEDAAKKVSNFADGFRDFAKVAGAALTVVGAGLTLYAKNANDFTVDYVQNAKQMSRETGATIEQASQLIYVLGRVGISAQDASTTFGIFSKKINEAASTSDTTRIAQQQLSAQIEKTQFDIAATTKEIQLHGDKSGELGIKLRGLQADLAGLQDKMATTGSSLSQLGIDTADATGKQKDFQTILLEVADKFKTMPDGATKTALAMDLFGRSGKDMVKVLNLGSQGITDLEKNADKLGLTLTAQNIGAVNDYIESQKKMKENSDAIKLSVGTLTAPVLTQFNSKIADLTGKFQELNPQMKGAVAAVLAFGGPIATAGGGLLSFLGNYDQAKPALDGIISKLPIIGTVFTSLGAVLTNPWVLLIMGIVIAVGFLLDHFGLLKPLLEDVNILFGQMAEVFMTAIQPALDMMRQAFENLAPLMPYLSVALKYIAEVIGVFLVVAIVGLVTLLAAVAIAITYLFTAIVEGASILKNNLVQIFDFITAIFSGNMDAITAKGISAMTWLLSIFGGTFGQLVSIVGNTMALIINNFGGSLGSLVSSITNWTGNFYNSGKALVQAFGDGIAGAFGQVKNTVSNGLNSVRKLLPFSDAKEGPLSDLTLSGRRLMETIAEGVVQGAPTLHQEISASLGASISPIVDSGNGAAPTSAVAASQGQGGNTFYVTIEKDADSDYFFQKFGRNLELSGKGMATQPGSVG